MSHANSQTVAGKEWLQQSILQEPTGPALFVAVVISLAGPFLSSVLMGTGPPHPVTIFPMVCVTIWLWWHMITIARKDGLDWTRNRCPYWYIAKCPDMDR